MHRFPMRRLVAGITLSLSLMAGSAWSDEARHAKVFDSLSERALCAHVLHGDPFSRTELFFGRNRRGGVVTEEEFQDFLDNTVTPRFPDGLTVIDAKGQFRGEGASLPEKEDAKLLILLYPFDRKSSALVEEIRSEYKRQFEQQSVLRVDEQSCVSF